MPSMSLALCHAPDRSGGQVLRTGNSQSSVGNNALQAAMQDLPRPGRGLGGMGRMWGSVTALATQQMALLPPRS